MTIAIALVATLGLFQFLVFGVLLAFAIQLTRLQHTVDHHDIDLNQALDLLTELHDRADSQETWAESVTELQNAIVNRLNDKDED